MSARFDMFEIWLALGCPQSEFDPWYDQPQMTPADAWAQLLGAIRGNVASLCKDTNPPAPACLIDAARLRMRPVAASAVSGEPTDEPGDGL